MPERAERWRPAPRPVAPARTPPVDDPGRRPLLLLDPPEPIEDPVFDLPEGAPARFTWRRVSRRVVRAEGPERLSPEWWRPRPDGRETRTRDYYRVEDGEGGCATGCSARGCTAASTGADDERAPSWWMHGVLP
jgi:protein ImuB